MMNGRVRNVLAAVAAVGVAVALTACGSSGGSSAPEGSDDSGAAANAEPVKVTVGVIPNADYTPVYHALEQGYFEEEGLEVEIQPLQGGAAAIPGLLSGDMDISVTNWVSFVQAIDKNIPVQAFAPGALATPSYSGVYASEASGIATAEDLVGKTVAVTELKTVTELTTLSALEEAGVDTSQVTFTTLPLNTIVPAVAEDKVDAGWLVEPFISAGKAAGLVEVLDLYSGRFMDRTIGGYIATADFAKQKPEVLSGFAKALNRAIADMNADNTLIEDALIALGSFSEEQRGTMMMPTFVEGFSIEDVQVWADAMVEFDFIEEGINLDGAFANVG